jgi:hypothetical protein
MVQLQRKGQEKLRGKIMEMVKGLSLNNKCFPEGDKGAREHKPTKVRTFQFLKANQYFAETVHP